MDIFFCIVFAMPLCASVYMCLFVTSWERVDLLGRFKSYLQRSVGLWCSLLRQLVFLPTGPVAPCCSLFRQLVFLLTGSVGMGCSLCRQLEILLTEACWSS